MVKFHDYPLILTPPSPRKLEDKDIELIERIREYMGEEVYEKYFMGEDDLPIRFHSFKRRTTLGWLYVKGGKPIVISMSASGLKKLKTTYGPLTGDEGAGFKYVHKDYSKKLSNNIFYLENGKFIKSDEKGKGAWN